MDDQDSALEVLALSKRREKLLPAFARLIHKWVRADEETERTLSKQNLLDLVVTLTRFNAKSLQHKGNVRAVFNDLTSQLMGGGSSCAWFCSDVDKEGRITEVLGADEISGLRSLAGR